MKKAVLMGFAVFFMMAGEAIGDWWWSPSDVEIVPQHPTSCDVVVITLSGTWGDTCMPYDSTVSVVGNDIYLDVIWPDVSCLPMITSWEWTESVGPLSVGTYTVYARLIGYPQIPEEYTQMTEFIVTGQIIYVDADANGANDGSSWANAYNYLQDALAIVNSISVPVEIRVAEGIYTPDSNSADPNGSGDREATFQLINGVTLRGGYAGFGEPDPNARDFELYETILSGDLGGNDIDVNNIDVNDLWDLWNEPSRAENSYHVVTGSGTDATAVLDGFEIISGNANIRQDRGGGMYNESGSPMIIQCSFSRNSASYGGALYNEESHPIMRGCVFTGNFAYSCGGGIRNRRGSNPSLLNCVFVGNLAGRSWGGGIENISGSNVTLGNCTFKRNAAYRGGGMLNYKSSPVLTNCTFTGNSAEYGGGMCSMDRSNVILINCIFSGNSADENGGGMYCEESCPTTITNCTLSRNSAQEEGGGLYISRPPVYAGGPSSKMGDGTCTITNCIFWENWPQQIVDLNLWPFSSAEYSDVQGGWPGEGSIDADPCFVDAENGDYHLLASSPCIDAGDPNYIAEPNETDLDGNPRVIGGRIDMGAYEYSPAIPAEVRIVPRTINLASKGKWITALIWLPEDYDVTDIEPNSIVLEGEIEPEWFAVDEQQQVAIVRFRRSEVQEILNPPMADQVELTITGQLTDGTIFEGTDVIRVIDKGKKK